MYATVDCKFIGVGGADTFVKKQIDYKLMEYLSRSPPIQYIVIIFMINTDPKSYHVQLENINLTCTNNST